MFFQKGQRPYLILLIGVFSLFIGVAIVSAQTPLQPEPLGLLPDAPEFAVHGPYWVGTTMLRTSTDTHPTTVMLWYPALNPDGLEEAITYDWNGMLVEGHALEDAAIDPSGGPYPLVIFAHGTNAAPSVFNYLNEHLASQGFVVMAISYEDNWYNPLPLEDFTATYTRALDVSWQIDYAANLSVHNGLFEGMVDTERVAVIGHSFGGETALIAGGAVLDLGPDSWCAQYPDTANDPNMGGIPICITAYEGAAEALAQEAGLPGAPENLWPLWNDPRVDAIIPMAPGLQDFSSASFSAVTLPTMLMVGGADTEVHSDMPLYFDYGYTQIPSGFKAFVNFEGGNHGLMVDSCAAMPWVYDFGMEFYCSDAVWDMDRAHDLTNHFAAAFLRGVLYDDGAAREALLPENVTFEGIVYETTIR